MTEEQKKKIENRILFLSIGIIAILIVFLILIGVTKKADTLIFPVVVAVFLALFWAVTDVLPVVWMKQFEGKTDEQKKSYYVYAGMDLIGLGGLVYFLVDMNSTTGAIIYVACLFLKKRFREEFYGTAKDDGQDEPEEEAGASDLTGQNEPEEEAGASDLIGQNEPEGETGTSDLTGPEEEAGASDLTGQNEPEEKDGPEDGTEADGAAGQSGQIGAEDVTGR